MFNFTECNKRQPRTTMEFFPAWVVPVFTSSHHNHNSLLQLHFVLYLKFLPLPCIPFPDLSGCWIGSYHKDGMPGWSREDIMIRTPLLNIQEPISIISEKGLAHFGILVTGLLNLNLKLQEGEDVCGGLRIKCAHVESRDTGITWESKRILCGSKRTQDTYIQSKADERNPLFSYSADI